jgi:hypothetical protein
MPTFVVGIDKTGRGKVRSAKETKRKPRDTRSMVYYRVEADSSDDAINDAWRQFRGRKTMSRRAQVIAAKALESLKADPPYIVEIRKRDGKVTSAMQAEHDQSVYGGYPGSHNKEMIVVRRATSKEDAIDRAIETFNNMYRHRKVRAHR